MAFPGRRGSAPINIPRGPCSRPFFSSSLFPTSLIYPNNHSSLRITRVNLSFSFKGIENPENLCETQIKGEELYDEASPKKQLRDLNTNQQHRKRKYCKI